MMFSKAPRIAMLVVVFEKAITIQKTHSTYHAAQYLRGRGVGLLAALKLLTRRKKYEKVPAPAQAAHLVLPRCMARGITERHEGKCC